MILYGYKTRAAFRIETGELGEPIAVVTGDQIPVKSIQFPLEYRPDATTRMGGEITMVGYHNIAVPLLVCAFGYEHGESPKTSGGKYRHVIELQKISERPATILDQPSPSGKVITRGTLVIENGSVIEIPSVAVDTFTIDIQPPETVDFSFGFTGFRRSFDPVVNTTFGASLPSSLEKMKPAELDLYVWPLFETTFSSTQTLLITESGALQTTVSIPAGTYTAMGLAVAVELALNANTNLTGTYTVTYSAKYHYYEIMSTIDFTVDGGSILEYLGLETGTTLKKNWRSTKYPVYTKLKTPAGGDKYPFSQLSVTISHTKDDTIPAFQPARDTGEPTCQANFTLPRIDPNNTSIINSGEPVGMKMTLTDVDTSDKVELVIPFAIVRSNTTPITGTRLVRGRFNIETMIGIDRIHVGTIYNSNFTRSLDLPSTTATVWGFYQGEFYVGDSSGVLYRYTNNTSTSTIGTTTNGGAIYAMTTWNKKLYFGSGNRLYSYDSTGGMTEIGTLSVSTAIRQIFPIGNKLALFTADGSFHTYDGATITMVAQNTAATTGFFGARMYRGNVYWLWVQGSDSKLMKWDGTSTTTERTYTGYSYSGAVGVSVGRLFTHVGDGAAGFSAEKYDGTTWTTWTGNPTMDVHCFVDFDGFFVYVALNGTVRFLDPMSRSETTLASDTNTPVNVGYPLRHDADILYILYSGTGNNGRLYRIPLYPFLVLENDINENQQL